MNNVQKSAKEFIRKYGLSRKRITVTHMESVLRLQGFKIVRYSRYYNAEKIRILLEAIDQLEYSRVTSAFTYIDKTKRIVFLDETVSDEDALVLLLHEEAHIFLDHTYKNGIFATDTQKEREANYFAEFVLKYHAQTNMRIVICIAAVITAGLIIGGSCFNSAKEAQQMTLSITQKAEPELHNNSSEVVITKTGDAYHRPDCGYIKGRDTILVIVEEAKNMGYAPCSVCNPEEE